MSELLVTVVDGTKARLFTVEEAEFFAQPGPNLVERKELLNPVQDRSGKMLWANAKTGRNRGAAHQAHGYDDHRQHHIDEFERRFTREIATEIVNATQTYQIRKVLLVAEPQILGFMRESLAPLLPARIHIQELAKDLCKLKPLEIHKYLTAKHLLPARQRNAS